VRRLPAPAVVDVSIHASTSSLPEEQRPMVLQRQNIRSPIPPMSKFKPMPEQWTPLPHNSNGRQSCPDMKSETITKRTQQVPCFQCCMEKGLWKPRAKVCRAAATSAMFDTNA